MVNEIHIAHMIIIMNMWEMNDCIVSYNEYFPQDVCKQLCLPPGPLSCQYYKVWGRAPLCTNTRSIAEMKCFQSYDLFTDCGNLQRSKSGSVVGCELSTL